MSQEDVVIRFQCDIPKDFLAVTFISAACSVVRYGLFELTHFSEMNADKFVILSDIMGIP